MVEKSAKKNNTIHSFHEDHELENILKKNINLKKENIQTISCIMQL